MRRWLILILVAVIGGTIAFSFYQPPARLMPTPLIFQQGLPGVFAATPGRGNDIDLFYATNRLPVGPRSNRLYAVVPGRELKLGIATLRIGEAATTWEDIHAWSTGARDDRRPWIRLQRMAELGTVEEGPVGDAALTPGTRAWLAALNLALDRHRDKDIIIFVHGANSTVERGAGQAAQFQHFTGNNAIVLLFAWPTAENFLRYPRDMETAFGAAPQLARLIELLARHSKARNIDVLTYSAGATVGSEGLALAGRAAKLPGAVDPRLGEVYHAAPDADTRVFVHDLKDYQSVAARVTVAANMSDAALRLSAVVNRASRAGRPDFSELSPEAAAFLLAANRHRGLELLRIRAGDIPGMRRGSHSFWYNDPWVSSDVLMTFLFHLSPGERGLVAGTAQGGQYWSFPPDYETRLPAAVAKLRDGQP